MNFSNEISNQISKFTKDAGIITGFIMVCTGITTQITSLFNSDLIMLTVIAGTYIIIVRFCLKIKKTTLTIMGQTKPQYSEQTRNRAVIFLKISSTLLALAFSFYSYSLISEYYLEYREEQLMQKKIEMSQKKIGIIISKFSSSVNDVFTNELKELINSNKEVKKSDSIEAISHPRFFATIPDHCQDTVASIFKHKYDRGLLVIGERDKDNFSGTNVFKCIICVNNLANLIIDSTQIDLRKSDEKTIYIRNPSIIDLGYEGQAQGIADFILGLLHYNAKQFESSEHYFKKACTSQNSDEQNNKKFIGQCWLYLGASHFKKGEYKKAFNDYQLGLKSDSTNANLFYNIATIYLQNNDSIQAYTNYLKANHFDGTLKIPFEKKVHNGGIKHPNQIQSTNYLSETEWAAHITAAKNTKFGFPQICKTLQKHANVNTRTFLYELLFNFEKESKLAFYVNPTYDILVLAEDGGYRIIGKMFVTRDPAEPYTINDFCGNEWKASANGTIYSSGGEKIGEITKYTQKAGQEINNKQKNQTAYSKAYANKNGTGTPKYSNKRLDERFPQACRDSIHHIFNKKEKQSKYIFVLFFGDNLDLSYFVDSDYSLIFPRGDAYECIGKVRKSTSTHSGTTSISIHDFCGKTWTADSTGVIYYDKKIVGKIMPLK